MQQFYGDKCASKEKCVVVQVNFKKQKKNTKKKHEKCGYLNMIPMHFSHNATDENGKCFFVR